VTIEGSLYGAPGGQKVLAIGEVQTATARVGTNPRAAKNPWAEKNPL
jgi:hypothetical protein